MADETTAPQERRSSLLYAMGKLTAQVEATTNEVTRLREAHEGLPQQFSQTLGPFAIRLDDHSLRITRLEKRQWLYLGGGVVVLYVLSQALPLLHITLKP